MERHGYRILFLFYLFSFVSSQNDGQSDLMTTVEDFVQPANLVLWPNGTIPFYINTDHFDNEQTLAIMSSLSLLAFRTCLRFAPAMVPPSPEEHVLVLANPSGVRKCALERDNEHYLVKLGYDCLKAPWLDRLLLRALGLPFEHNRANREDHVDVQYENIEQYAIPYFTKDHKMPAALRALPYDIHSALHFGDRDFSKNGHRTIIFKDRDVTQNRAGLTDLDIRKIEIIYGPECQKRDRMEKIELCHRYPGIPMVRRKRSADVETTRSLRVNPNITPPPEIDKVGFNISEELLENIRSLDIDDEVQYILDDVHKLTVKALQNARMKYCNDSEDLRRSQRDRSDVLGIIHAVADYAQSMVDHASQNLTSFCEKSESVEKYERYRCFGCTPKYYSTKHGMPYRSTKHRPYIPQSTTHQGGYSKSYEFRAHDDNKTVVKDETRETEALQRASRKRRQLDGTMPDLLKNNENYVASTESIRPMERLKRAAYDEPRNRRRTRPVSEGSEDSDDKVYVSDTGDDSSEERGDKLQIEWPTQDIQEKWTHKDTEEYHRDESKDKESREGNRQRKKPEGEEMEQQRLEKDTVEDRDTRQSGEREGKRPRKKPVNEESEEQSVEKDTAGEKDERQSGERVRKRPRNKPVNEESEEQRVEKDDVEDRDKPQSGERQGKMQTKRPVSKEKEDTQEEDSDEDSSDESESDDSEEKKEIKRPPSPSKDVQEIPLEEPEVDDENDEKDSLRTLDMSEANKEFYHQRRWPGGDVPYYINRSSTLFDVKLLRHRLALVNHILLERTCTHIIEITQSQLNKFADYLVLDSSPDYVTGRVGGPQNFGSVELLKGGQHRQHTAMMVMAMLGFYFELARHDRDEYVKVHMRHVRPDKLHHFEKLGEDATLPLPFDYKSATMPAWMFWRRIGKQGISTVATYKDKDPDGTIMRAFGQNKKLLSDGDIIKINTLYGTKCKKKGEEENKEEPQD